MGIKGKNGVPGFVTRIRQGNEAKAQNVAKRMGAFIGANTFAEAEMNDAVREAQLAFMQAPVKPQPNLGDILREAAVHYKNVWDDDTLAFPVQKVIEPVPQRRWPTGLLIQELQARKEAEGLIVSFQPKEKVSVSADRTRYVERLIAMGWYRLNSGHYSEVFAHPKSDKAIKVCKERDEDHQDQWPLFAAWAQTVKSPHLIKVYNIKRHNGFYVAIMERLDSVHNSARFTDDLPYKKQVEITSQAMSEYKYMVRSIQPEDDMYTAGENAKIRFIRKHFPKLLPTLKLLQVAKMIDDCHDGNYGYRADGTPVIFDPVTFIGNEKLLNRLQSNEKEYGFRSLTRKAA